MSVKNGLGEKEKEVKTGNIAHENAVLQLETKDNRDTD